MRKRLAAIERLSGLRSTAILLLEDHLALTLATAFRCILKSNCGTDRRAYTLELFLGRPLPQTAIMYGRTKAVQLRVSRTLRVTPGRGFVFRSLRDRSSRKRFWKFS